MGKKHSKILAIDPGTRLMGIALLEDGTLIYHGVVAIKRRGSPHQVLSQGRRMVLRLIEDFRPRTLAVEKAFFAGNRRVALVNVLADEIVAVGRSRGLGIASYAPSTIKKFVCGNGQASKGEVARVVVARYPELRVYLTQDRAWKERYHQNMFDAVALGMLAAARAQ